MPNRKMRLNDREIEHLLLENKNKNKQYRLNPEQLKALYIFRGYDKALVDEAVDNGISPNKINHGWYKGEHFSLHFKEDNDGAKDDFAKDIVEQLKDYSPNFPKIKRNKSKDGHLLVIDIADLHINKYADTFLTGAEYNSQIAVERALKGTEGLIQKASGFNIDKILFVIGNDVLNTDTLSRTTTKGTQQDTDVDWFTAFNIAKDCYIKCIEMCLQVADVDVIHCPSNHDFMSGCFLAETISAWFRLCKNITFDTSPKYRKYYQYYNNMIELEHGDKGKMLNLPLTMANEEPKMWAETRFRYGYLHHVHHQDKTQFKSGKDFTGVNVTYLRSPSSADLWHSDNQYFNTVAIEGFIHCKKMGRVSHLTHYF